MSDMISLLSRLHGFAITGVAKLKKRFLSRIKKEILRAAAGTGEFHVIQVDQFAYPIIRGGDAAMGNQDDPLSLATYYEAFESLCSDGYIEHVDGVRFRLTVAGLNKVRKLI